MIGSDLGSDPGLSKELINPFLLWIHQFFLFSCTMMGSDLGHPLYPLPWGAYYKVETLLKDECLF